MLTSMACLFVSLLSMCQTSHAIQLADRDVHIASWNIQIFGQTKLRNVKAMAVIVEILSRYDLIAIQEVRDVQQTALPTLVARLNEQAGSNIYSYVVSVRLGRSTSKEQYAFLYKNQLFEVVDTYQYPDENDKFERPPFAARFKSLNTEIEDFGIIDIHTSPTQAVSEINHLAKVHEILQLRWKSSAILITGDFNADCTYVKSGEMKNISLRKDKSFKWLIDDIQDTTVKTTDCSYDRFVTNSDKMINDMVPGSVKVFTFDQEYGLDAEMAEDVSDHYPIEFSLKGKINHDIQRQYRSCVSFTVHDSTVKSLSDLRYIYNSVGKPQFVDAGFTVQAYKLETRLNHVTVTKTNSKSILCDIETLKNLSANVVTDVTVELVKAGLTSSLFVERPYISGMSYENASEKCGVIWDFEMTCTLQSPYICKFTVTSRIN